jgi:hypothetical protein
MFKRNRRTDAPKERPKTRGRGLGPFTGGQLTILIVTFAVLLMFPIGAWALTFSNVAITDPGGVNQARVDTGHNLHTAIADTTGANVAKVDSLKNLAVAVRDPVSGLAARTDSKSNLNTALHDATTGVAAKVNASAQLKVSPAPATSESLQVNTPQLSSTFNGPSIAQGPTVVTSVHVDTYLLVPGNGAAVQLFLVPLNVASVRCDVAEWVASSGLPVDAIDSSSLGVTTLDYGAGGLFVPSGYDLCPVSTDTSKLAAAVFAFRRSDS